MHYRKYETEIQGDYFQILLPYCFTISVTIVQLSFVWVVEFYTL